jgi:hypothetical protein
MSTRKPFRSCFLSLGLVVLALAAGCATPRKPVPEFPAGLSWLGPDISGWPRTASLVATVNPPAIGLSYDKASVWPVRPKGTDGPVNANAWIVFQYGDAWYASTWEWLRPSQTVKRLNGPLGSYIKNSRIPARWNPAPGQRVGLMVSGLARKPGDRTVAERSNVFWTEW